MAFFQILCAIGLLFFSIYYYYASKFNFWKNRNVPGPKPTFLIGNLKDILRESVSLSDQLKNWYNEYKDEPVFGIFQGKTPVLMVNDLDLIKDVLIRDFSLFVDRGIHSSPKVEPLAQHLFFLEAETWRQLRAKLSPIFTSGKLKDMFPLIVECADRMDTYLEKATKMEEPVECRELAAKYTTDVIGSCAFGISMNALEDEDSEFRRMGKKFFEPTLKLHLDNILRFASPFLFEKLGPLFHNHEVDDFFINIVRDTIKYRKDHNLVRPDFINMLMQLREDPKKLDSIELTDTLLTAQAFVFFAAGFETSSTTISHALYELALHQDVQDKLREEIKENYNGTWTYNKIKDMKYLDKVFKETLRKYPVLGFLSRKAEEDYTFKDTKISIPKDTLIWISVYGIQNDPAIYPNPEKFDPERFNDDAVAARHPMSYIPFGDGPRNCIGARFAYNQTKLGIATILRNYKVQVCDKTMIPYESEPKNILLAPKGGMHLRITKL